MTDAAFENVPAFSDENSRKAIAGLLAQRIQSGWQGLSERRDMVVQWRYLFEGPPVVNADDPTGSNFVPDVFVPETRAIVETQAARAVTAILDPVPLIEFAPEQAELYSEGQALAYGIDWQLREQVGIASLLDLGIRGAFIDGVRVVRTSWDRQQAVVRSHVPVDETVLADFQEAGIEVKEEDIEAGVLAVDTLTTIKDCPAVDQFSLDNFVVYPHNVRNLDDALLLGHLEHCTPLDLWDAVANGTADEDAVREILKVVPGKDPFDDTDQPLKSDADDFSGLGGGGATETDPDAKVFDIWTCVTRIATSAKYKQGEAVDYSKHPARWCEFRVEAESKTLLYARIIDVPLPTGQTWYTAIVPIPRDDVWVGYSICEIVQQPQAVLNDLYNQNLQAGMIDNLRLLRKTPSTKMELEDEPLIQGSIIEANPGDIEPIQFGGSRQGAFVDEQNATAMMQKVAGVSDYQMGQPGQSERTLGEIRTVVGEGNEKFKIIVGRIGEAVARIAAHVMAFNVRHLDTTVTYNSTLYGDARGATRTITGDDCRLQGKFRAVGTPEMADKRLQIVNAEKIAMFCAENPLVIPMKQRLWEVSRRVLTAFGVTDYVSLIGTKEEAIQADLDAASAPPPAGEPPSLSGKLDETATLAELLKEDYPDATFEERFTKALQMRQQALVLDSMVAQATGAGAEPSGESKPPTKPSKEKST